MGIKRFFCFSIFMLLITATHLLSAMQSPDCIDRESAERIVQIYKEKDVEQRLQLVSKLPHQDKEIFKNLFDMQNEKCKKIVPAIKRFFPDFDQYPLIFSSFEDFKVMAPILGIDGGKILDDVKMKLQMRNFFLHHPDPKIRAEIEEARDICNIKDKFFVFEINDCKPCNMAATGFIFKDNNMLQEYFVIQNPKRWSFYDKFGSKAFTGYIYHELGHFSNGDTIPDRSNKKRSLLISHSAGIAFLKGIISGIKPHKFQRVLAGLGVAAIVIPYNVYQRKQQRRQKEYKADLFAINQLIKLQKITSLVLMFMTWIQNWADMNTRNKIAEYFLGNHPRRYRRAQLTIEKLQAAGYNLLELPLDPDNQGKSIQPEFTELVKHHFPGIYADALKKQKQNKQFANTIKVQMPNASGQNKKYLWSGLAVCGCLALAGSLALKHLNKN
jgi:hypothetical protein